MQSACHAQVHVTCHRVSWETSFNERQFGECESWLSAQLPSLDPPPPPPCPEWDERTKHPSSSSPSSPPLHFLYDQAAFSSPPPTPPPPLISFLAMSKTETMAHQVFVASAHIHRERDREKGTDRPTDRSTNERGTRWVWSVGRFDLSGKLSPSTPRKPKRTNSFLGVHYDHCMATSHKSTCSLIRAAPRMARGSFAHHAHSWTVVEMCSNIRRHFVKSEKKSFFLELLQCLELSLFSSSHEKGWQNKREEGKTVEKMERKKEKRNKRGKRSGGSSRKSKKRERKGGDVLYTAPSCPEKGTEVEGLSPPPCAIPI